MQVNKIQNINSNSNTNFKGYIDKPFYDYFYAAKRNKAAEAINRRPPLDVIEYLNKRFNEIPAQLNEFMSKLSDNIALTFEIYRGKGEVFNAPAFVDKESGYILFAGTKNWPVFKKGKVDTANNCINLPKTCQYWGRPYEAQMKFEDVDKWTENLIENVKPEDINIAIKQGQTYCKILDSLSK